MGWLRLIGFVHTWNVTWAENGGETRLLRFPWHGMARNQNEFNEGAQLHFTPFLYQ